MYSVDISVSCMVKSPSLSLKSLITGVRLSSGFVNYCEFRFEVALEDCDGNNSQVLFCWAAAAEDVSVAVVAVETKSNVDDDCDGLIVVVDFFYSSLVSSASFSASFLDEPSAAEPPRPEMISSVSYYSSGSTSTIVAGSISSSSSYAIIVGEAAAELFGDSPSSSLPVASSPLISPSLPLF